MLDELVAIIQTLQTRIREHTATLRENETRTRMALIDPLLKVLGWDTADPSLVTPEYNVAGRAADYALLQGDGKPAATIEAKKLGEPLESHRMQMLNYSNVAGVQYAGLTDGNRWELYEVFKQAPLDVSITNSSVHLTGQNQELFRLHSVYGAAIMEIPPHPDVFANLEASYAYLSQKPE